MLLTLRESAESKAERVDTKLGIIYGVKVLSETSRNGFVYPRETRLKAHRLLEGLRVNINHKKQRDAREDIPLQQRFGKLINIREGVNGTFADLKYNIKHSMAEQIVYAATELSDTLGMSINGSGNGTQKTPDGKQIVAEITRLKSCDLVADPGSTLSLFESEQMEPELDPALEGIKTHIMTLLGNVGSEEEAMKALKEYVDSKGEPEEEEVEVEESDKTALARLKTEKECITLCESLKHPITSDVIDLLADLPTEEKRKALLTKLKGKATGTAKSGIPIRESETPVDPAAKKKHLLKILRG